MMRRLKTSRNFYLFPRAATGYIDVDVVSRHSLTQTELGSEMASPASAINLGSPKRRQYMDLGAVMFCLSRLCLVPCSHRSRAPSKTHPALHLSRLFIGCGAVGV